MPHVLVRHRVQDFDRWKPYFDRDEQNRRSVGLDAGRVMRNADDPQEVWLLFEAQDLAKAREFAQSEDLKQIMTEAGVIDRPDMVFLD
jgi:hypothetical protein